MTKYIKTGTTEFEQFNGSDEMCEKYGAEYELVSITDGDPNIPIDKQYQVAFHYWLKTLGAPLNIEIGDWIATGVNGEHWPVKDEIFKKTYKKLPVIPKYVADDLEHSKRAEYSITMFLDDCFGMVNDIVTNKTWNWCDTYMERHPDSNDYHVVLARAWLDGYEVEDD